MATEDSKTNAPTGEDRLAELRKAAQKRKRRRRRWWIGIAIVVVLFPLLWGLRRRPAYVPLVLQAGPQELAPLVAHAIRRVEETFEGAESRIRNRLKSA